MSSARRTMTYLIEVTLGSCIAGESRTFGMHITVAIGIALVRSLELCPSAPLRHGTYAPIVHRRSAHRPFWSYINVIRLPGGRHCGSPDVSPSPIRKLCSGGRNTSVARSPSKPLHHASDGAGC